MTAVAAALPEVRLAGDCSPPHRTDATRRTARAYASGKEDYLRRLRKIEGQVRGLQRIIEADTWCPDVVTQVASATRALQEVAVGLLSDHLRHCVSNAAGKSEADAYPAPPLTSIVIVGRAGTIGHSVRLGETKVPLRAAGPSSAGVGWGRRSWRGRASASRLRRSGGGCCRVELARK